MRTIGDGRAADFQTRQWNDTYIVYRTSVAMTYVVHGLQWRLTAVIPNWK